MPKGDLYGVVPNFSEGRRADVVDAIVDALHVPGARVVYAEADADHNRLDTTVLGDADAVRASAFAGAALAADLIDMDLHRGGHPRMGAADVIPFMPVRGVTIGDCVTLARGFARELAEALDLPVYLYDRAALVPERASLAEVRRGEIEGLREAVRRGERLPDFGPSAIGRAGATAVGARKPLVAFNVYLDSADEQAAKEIARALRESNGGLPAVRAIGFAVPERGGVVTVSMNLVDHEVTGLETAFEGVERLADGYGIDVTGSEIVGLVPAAALRDGADARLRLEEFDPDRQVLERLVDTIAETETEGVGTMGDARIREMTLDRYLEAMGSSDPTPGGGAAAATAGATGAALIAMVGRLTVGKPEFLDLEERIRAMVDRADEARHEFLALGDRDAEAFELVMSAYRMPRGSDVEQASRSEAIQRGLEQAASVPLEIARRAVDLMELAEDATAMGNPNAASDGMSAAAMLFAAVLCARANVEINASSLHDAPRRQALLDEVAGIRERADTLLEQCRTAFGLRLAS